MNWVIFLVRSEIFQNIRAHVPFCICWINNCYENNFRKINWTMFLFHFRMNLGSQSWRELPGGGIHLGGCYLLSHKGNVMLLCCVLCTVCIPHALSLRISREKKCPTDTTNENELNDNPWLLAADESIKMKQFCNLYLLKKRNVVNKLA